MDLFKYAYEDNVAYLQTHLESVHIKDPKGKSLLHYAVLGSSHDVIDYLLNQDIDVNLQDQTGETAIFDCARKGKLIVAKKLIQRYAKLDIKNNKGETLFHLAAHKGDISFIKLLIEMSANPNELTNEDKLPIHYAILAGHVEVVNFLIDYTKQSWFYLDAYQNSFLHYACRTTNKDMVRLFLNKDLDPNALNTHFETPLFNIIRYSSKDILIHYLNQDAFIDIYNRRFETPMTLAKVLDQKEFYEILNEFKLSPAYQRLIEQQALTIYVLNRDHNKLKQLIDQGYGLKKDRLKKTALDYANQYKMSICINLLRPLI
ncbi:Ribulose-5-phosphate 4-epimerase and related epimerases and aldolases [Acholeplasma oculi]|uniref:Ankyrin repeat-containing protein n=1 Tax=Acholeplasma oculi TaxID=35623 RepID=A0A061AAZ1_9MOLU|nr:ankyrin repeat domain-containing protein [Acholeplasma oculi]CDR31065.1 Ankyrin repeat-containing protein [Acholeplasma oculi]SKC36750.1 Ankyrin repeat [Acholeplasma oculi]SUT90672.1 Ribulose-5-phosphate 4-epimerase and related epimerases and aldolases [Acholeplasma oculi]